MRGTETGDRGDESDFSGFESEDRRGGGEVGGVVGGFSVPLLGTLLCEREGGGGWICGELMQRTYV